ncbi:VRR-NUC domain-containing protein [Catalinimonas alkaloidigena]|uniref:phosphodiesterase I n=1 Tax=Catalinimonas alkaloidigena TaxID=1075417 RepID=A0A1G9RB46_9BACT|nr:VRR-NUC domain-containing protein [Catalinimonas alkaloidigena]SDM20529.1 VRR-NUC domain-containing protein [Catalinimonas alkaloidigena]
MARPTEIELPPRYYLEYFEYVLRFVQEQYQSTLSTDEFLFLERFAALSEDARCLFVRMANRRGLFFRPDRFEYAEIDHLPDALAALLDAGFAERLHPDHAPDATELLCIFTRGELVDLIRCLLPEAAGLSKLKKPELVAFMVEEISFEEIVACLNEQETLVRQGYVETVEMVKFCFFGTLDADMSQFVVRDIGHAKLENMEGKKFTPFFRSRRDMEDKLAISRAYQHFRYIRDTDPPELVFDWLMRWSSHHRELSAAAQPLFDRMALKTAALLERAPLPELALQTYRLTEKAPSRERQARLLHKLDRTEEAQHLCDAIKAQPQNAEERFFAIDFCNRLAKKKGAVKATTDTLRQAEAVEISPAFRYQVEQGVIEHFRAQGKQAAHSENYLWRGFFGLALWDVLFDDEADALHNPLQRAPSDLFKPDFLENRRARIEAELQFLDRKRHAKKLLSERYAEKEGMLVPLVGWHETLLPLVLACLQKLKPKQLKAIFLEMARDLKENGRGFPDLFVWDGKGYEFIEVKSPTDQLSAQQLHWLHFFEEIGVKARVLRVVWGEEA